MLRLLRFRVQLFRSMIAVLVLIALPVLACDPRPLKDSDDSFAEAVARRFARSGVTDVALVTHTGEAAAVYVLLGSNVRLSIRDDGGLFLPGAPLRRIPVLT
jgi:predicted cobalt transporter CbtA